jgi:signal transduction histidine kinase
VLNGGLLLFALTSGAVLVWTFYRHWELYRSHAPWIVLLYVVTLGALGAYEAGYSPVDGMRLVPFTAPFQALVYGNVLFRYDLPDVSFRTRRIGLQEAMQTLEDGILIVDEDWRILEFNPIVRETFGGPSQLVGTGLADVVGDACVDSLQSGDTELLSPSPAKRMEATATPITEGDAVIGHIVLLRDVTALKAREQRLSVLNRVVRHNVRNEMTVVRGNSEVLEERLNGEDADIAANIRSAADDVVELGNKARQLESVLDSADQTAPVHVTRLGREVVSDVAAQYPDVAFSITGKEAVIHTNPDVLRTVIETLVENGAQHNDAAAPEVEVTVEHTGRDLTVTISDNGPGIPAVELDAFGGIETDLEHGMGLGLRLVQWGIEKLDGSVTFATDDGTTATITVPADDPDTAVQETASA